MSPFNSRLHKTMPRNDDKSPGMYFKPQPNIANTEKGMMKMGYTFKRKQSKDSSSMRF